MQSKIITMVFEIERELISSRTKGALRAKKVQGIKLGRPKGTGESKLDKFESKVEALLANSSTQKFIANRFLKHKLFVMLFLSLTKYKIIFNHTSIALTLLPSSLLA